MFSNGKNYPAQGRLALKLVKLSRGGMKYTLLEMEGNLRHGDARAHLVNSAKVSTSVGYGFTNDPPKAHEGFTKDARRVHQRSTKDSPKVHQVRTIAHGLRKHALVKTRSQTNAQTSRRARQRVD